jgi:hypothetical protein
MADVMEFVGGCVLEVFRGFLGIEIKEDGGIGLEFVDEAVGLRLDHGIDLRADDGIVGEEGKDTMRGGVEVGTLPCVERLLELRGAGERLRGENELAEIVVGEVAVHGGFALLEANVRSGGEEALPVGISDGRVSVLLGRDGENGVAFGGVEGQDDAIGG